MVLCPDAHCGYGMPIGGVAALRNVICPNMVGVDIGCGMHAVKLDITSIDVETLKKILGRMRELIPVGFNHRSKVDDKYMPMARGYAMAVVDTEYEKAKGQIGTLGGGNHFEEVQLGSDGYIWFMIHSGSRNLGMTVAEYHDAIAQQLNAKWYSSIPKSSDLAFLPMDSDEGHTLGRWTIVLSSPSLIGNSWQISLRIYSFLRPRPNHLRNMMYTIIMRPKKIIWEPTCGCIARVPLGPTRVR
jgi:tRNA-splicing ligase RtcB